MVIACTIDIQPAFIFQVVENVYSLMRNFFRHPQRFVQNFIFWVGGFAGTGGQLYDKVQKRKKVFAKDGALEQNQL